MIGGYPKLTEEDAALVDVLGPLDKNQPDQLKQFIAALKSASFFIYPTTGDTYSMPTLEAMAFGCPPLVSDYGAVPELVADNITGFILPVTASGLDYATKIQALLAVPGAYNDMCRAAYARYESTHRWDKQCLEVVAFMKRRIAETEAQAHRT